MKEIESLECTCIGCPEQYEGTLKTGESIYIRIRWGTARIDIAGETVHSKVCDDEYKGCFDEGELKDFLHEAGINYTNL